MRGAARRPSIRDALPDDGLLCSDSWRGFAAVARKRRIHHEPINMSAGQRCRDGLWHVPNANAYHSRLKAWIAGFRGVATHYLPAYLAWHHVLAKRLDKDGSRPWVKMAVNS